LLYRNKAVDIEMVLNMTPYGAMIGETVHSGHFMMSSLTDESSDTDSGCTRHVGSIQTANGPVSVSRKNFISNRNTLTRQSNNETEMSGNSVADVIDGSLVTLLQCMTLDYRFAVCYFAFTNILQIYLHFVCILANKSRP